MSEGRRCLRESREFISTTRARVARDHSIGVGRRRRAAGARPRPSAATRNAQAGLAALDIATGSREGANNALDADEASGAEASGCPPDAIPSAICEIDRFLRAGLGIWGHALGVAAALGNGLIPPRIRN